MQENLYALAIGLLKRRGAQHQVAFRLGLDMDEIRNLEIWETLYSLARSGRHTAATNFWLKARAGALSKPSKLQFNDSEYTQPPTLVIVINDGEPVQWD